LFLKVCHQLPKKHFVLNKIVSWNGFGSWNQKWYLFCFPTCCRYIRSISVICQTISVWPVGIFFY
jgi:hypothetical protein